MKLFPEFHPEKKMGYLSTKSSPLPTSTRSSAIPTTARYIVILKVLVCLSLVLASLICGVGSYYILRTLSLQQQRLEYLAVAEQFKENLFINARNIEKSLNSVADMIGMYCPDRSQWPYCDLESSSYNDIVSPLVKMANGRAIGFAPIILPTQISSWENVTYRLYESEGIKDVGYSSFGKGIYYVRNGTRHRAYNTTAGTRQILAPIQLIANLKTNKAAPFYDLHSDVARAEAIEGVIECFEKYGRGEVCIFVTDIIHLVQDPQFRPAVLVVYPINPANDPHEIVAFTYFVVNWDTLISQSLPRYVNSVDAVLSSDSGKEYSFRVSNGNVNYRGRGDRHDKRYGDLKNSFNIGSYLQGNQYFISLYPTNHFMTQYNDVNPVITSVVSFSVVLLTSIIFFVYDRVLNHDADEKALVVNTKRLFVRFISHEIRTPLNTVHLGVKLFIQELSTLLRELDDSSSSLNPTTISGNASPLMTLPEGEQKNDSTNYDQQLVKTKLHEWIELSQDIEISSDVAIVVLNDLINYDKISIGGLKIEISEVNLWSLTQKAVMALDLQARQANIAFTLDLELTRSSAAVSQARLESLTKLCVLGDEIKLGQVVRNLVANALRFTSSGGSVDVSLYWDDANDSEQIASSISSNEQANCLNICGSVKQKYAAPETGLEQIGSFVFVVRDNGAGITNENLTHLFAEGMHFHADLLQAGGGSGLGLWISKGIIELHGGRLIGHSDGEGKGSTFTFYLPAYSNPSPSYISANHSMSHPQSNPSDIRTRTQSTTDNIMDDMHHLTMICHDYHIRTILVVDDAPSSRKIVCRLLRLAGVKYIEAGNGQDCIDKYNNPEIFPTPPDLILMDYEMPIMNGPTAVKTLRSLGCSTPIIGLTGNVLPEDIEIFTNNGANAVLGKPLTIPRLSECLVNLGLRWQG